MVDAETTERISAVPEIQPLEQYDFQRAKTCASVRWLLLKAFGSPASVPEDLWDPMPSDQAHLRPTVVRQLLSGEPYCRAYAQIQQGAAEKPRDHSSLLQCLSKRSLCPQDSDRAVTETELRHIPIRTGAHLAVIDAMMSLASMDIVGAVKMAKEAEQLGGGSSWENLLLFWVNKLNHRLRESTETEDSQKSPPGSELQPVQPSCPTRWYWKLVPIRYRKDKVQMKHTPTFPVVSGLKDLSNGCALASVLHFYCPQLLRLEEVCLKDTMSVTDSLHNLQLVKEFCDRFLEGCCPLVFEDLLYTPPILRVNLICFVAELLNWFEVQKPDFVQPSHTLDLSDSSGLADCISPINGNSNSGSPSYIFKQPFLPISPGSPGSNAEGRMWSKKQLSRPLSAVAFSIPFPLDSDVDVVMGNPLFRSVSTDSLTQQGVTMGTAPACYSPPEDLSHLIQTAPLGELPAIEEALQITHTGRSARTEPRLRPEGAPDGFYLHSPDEGGAKLSSSAPCRSGMMYRPMGGGSEAAGRRDGSRRTSVGSRDDDSVLRDGSVDSDASEDLPKCSLSSNPGRPNHGSTGGRMTSFAERRKMLPETSLSSPTTPRGGQGPDSSGSPVPGSPAGAAEAQELGAKLEEKRRAIEAQKRRIEAIFTKHRQRLGKSAFMQLRREQGEGGATEEVESLSLEERLTRMEEQLRVEEEKEEKNKQKEEKVKEEEVGSGKDEKVDLKAPPKLEKQVTFSVDTRQGTEKGTEKEPPLVEYNEAVSKLTSALELLQKDMQRLTEQQQKLMGKKVTSPARTKPTKNTPPPSKAWMIPSCPKTSATPPRLSRESTRDFSPSSSPSRTNHAQATPKSPQAASSAASSRKGHNPVPKSPKRQRPPRPSDLSFLPLLRVLTPPQNVDTLPHLRRVSPSRCQVQTASSIRFGGPHTPQDLQPPKPQESASESGSSDDHTPLFSLELEPEPPRVLGSVAGGSSSGAPSECSFDSDVLLSAPLVDAEMNDNQGPLEEMVSSLERPLEVADETDQEQGAEIFSSDSMSDQTESESRGGVGLYFKEEGLSEEEMAQKRAVLLERQQRRAQEIKRRRQNQDNSRVSSADDLRASVTPPLSQSLPTYYVPPPPSQTTPPATPQRWGAFTRGEYERRHQLKIMADLGKALKQKPATVRVPKRQPHHKVSSQTFKTSDGTPKRSAPSNVSNVANTPTLSSPGNANSTPTRGSQGNSSSTPTRGSPGNAKSTPTRGSPSNAQSTPTRGSPGKTKNTPTCSTVDKTCTDSKLIETNPSHSESALPEESGATPTNGPVAMANKSSSLSDSPSRLMSPGRLANQNGDKDWENVSNASSPASIPEYTGPKLFKEPSLKSNKFIIHSALSRCCLAGKVNESQKTKIVEEMEKSPANHFLILLRDSNCQFRGVYTRSSASEELVRLCGVGPRVISPSCVESLYKYSSDRKQFSSIPSKTMSMSVDGFTVPAHVWQSRKQGTPKKAATPK